MVSDEIMKIINQTGLPAYWRTHILMIQLKLQKIVDFYQELYIHLKACRNTDQKTGLEANPRSLLSKSVPGEIIGLKGCMWG